MRIRNREAQRLAREIAGLTGETVSAAITEALRERLARLRTERKSGLADRLMRMGKECAALMEEPFRSVDHGDLLYDDRGLPK